MEISDLPVNKKIILFDSVCNLCNSFVQFVIQHDSKDIFRFVALQSDLGVKITAYLGLTNQNVDSFILYEPTIAYYYKSDAALQIASKLGGFFVFGKLLRVFPIYFRDFVYDFVASNRYKWFGKNESCMIPSIAVQNKFLS